MANIMNNENEKIGGFGFHALRYWYGKHVRDVFEQDGVWEFLRTRATVVSHTGSPTNYTPCLANISLVYCLENKIDSIHIYPRQSNMSNTAAIYTQYLIDKTDTKCRVYYLAKSGSDFAEWLKKMKRYVAYSGGEDSVSYKAVWVAEEFAMNRDKSQDKKHDNENCIWGVLNDDQCERLQTADCPIYVFVDDALYQYSWEYRLETLQKLKESGKDITIVCMSTLHRKVDTEIRKSVQNQLWHDKTSVFFNDEIYYKPLPNSVNIKNPAIIYTDFRHVHKDRADEFESRLKMCMADPDMLMQEVYLQYPILPAGFIG